MPYERRREQLELTPMESSYVVSVVDFQDSGYPSPRYEAAIVKLTGRNVDRVVRAGITQLTVEGENFNERFGIADARNTPAQMMDYLMQRLSLNHAIQCVINDRSDTRSVLKYLGHWRRTLDIAPHDLLETQTALTDHLETSNVLYSLMVDDIYRRLARLRPGDQLLQERFRMQHDKVSRALAQELPMDQELYDGLIIPFATRRFRALESQLPILNEQVCRVSGEDPTVRHEHPVYQRVWSQSE